MTRNRLRTEISCVVMKRYVIPQNNQRHQRRQRQRT